MMIHFMYPVFFFLMLLSSLLSLSANSFIMFWALMELNMLSFLGVLVTNFFKANKGESLVYLLVQGVSSVFILSMFLVMPLYMGSLSLEYFIGLLVLIKLGASPFHFWYFWMIEDISWDLFCALSSVQKFIPLMFLVNFLSPGLIIWVVMSSLLGAVGGVMSLSLKLMMGFSSLLNLAWMMGLILTPYLLMMYFLIYTVNLAVISSVFSAFNRGSTVSLVLKTSSVYVFLNLLFSLLSFIGVPPTMGFLAKIFSLVPLMSLSGWALIILLVSSGAMLWVYSSILVVSWKQASLGALSASMDKAMPWFLVILIPGVYLF